MSRSVQQPYPPAKAKAVVTLDGTTYVTVELTEEQTAFIREATLSPQFSIREETP